MPEPLSAETIEELGRLTLAYVKAREGDGRLLDTGADLILAFERHGGEHAVILRLLAAARRVAELPDVGEPEQTPNAAHPIALVWTHPSATGLYVTLRLRDGALRVSDSPRDVTEGKWVAAVLMAAAARSSEGGR